MWEEEGEGGGGVMMKDLMPWRHNSRLWQVMQQVSLIVSPWAPDNTCIARSSKFLVHLTLFNDLFQGTLVEYRGECVVRP